MLVRVSVRLRLVLNTINGHNTCVVSIAFQCVRVPFLFFVISLLIPLMTRIFPWKLFSFVLGPLQLPEMVCNCDDVIQYCAEIVPLDRPDCEPIQADIDYSLSFDKCHIDGGGV